MSQPAYVLPDDIRDYLDKNYFEKLPRVRNRNPKLLISFTGGSGVGKSTLSHKIGEDLGALVLETDEIRSIILKRFPNASKEIRDNILRSYGTSMYQRINELTPNGLIVRDGLVDLHHGHLLPLFKDQGFPLFIIGYDISRQKKEKLIRDLGDKDTVTAEALIGIIDEQNTRAKDFQAVYTPDILLHDDDMFDHDKVINAVKKKLESLS